MEKAPNLNKKVRCECETPCSVITLGEKIKTEKGGKNKSGRMNKKSIPHSGTKKKLG